MSDEGRRSPLPEALLSRWRSDLAAAAAPPRVLENLARLSDPRTLVVVTGQQPGPWGGPLFSLYKAATAIALAEKLAGETGRPAVPVFWVQGDDTDWGEVGWGAFPRPDLGLFRHRFDGGPAARHWVGSVRIPVPAEAREISRAWRRGGDLGGFLPRSDGEELASGFIRSLILVFGARGLLPLDGRYPEVRRAGASLWARYLEQHRTIAREVIEMAAALRSEGRAAPIDDAAADHGLFILEGEKRREVDPGTWDAEVREILERGSPEHLAPSVLLRAALQDQLFGSHAHVVGATEAAYLRQISPVYASLGVSEPVRVARLSAILVPRGLVETSTQGDAARDPDGWLRARAMEAVPAAPRSVLEELRRRVAGDLDRLGEAGPGDVAEVVGSARRKMDYELARIEDVLLRRARQEFYRKEPRLRNLGEFLRPRRGEQERGLSAATWALLSGSPCGDSLVEAAWRHLERGPGETAGATILEVDGD